MDRRHEGHQVSRERVYQEIARRLSQVDDSGGRQTRYYFAALFIQVTTRLPVYSSREIESLWRRWVSEHAFREDPRNGWANVRARRLIEAVTPRP